MSRLSLRLAALAAAAVLAVACSDDQPRSNEAQPVVDGRSFDRSSLGDLPQFPRSREAGGATEQDGATVQTFTVSGATPDQILAFYADALEADGWQVAEQPQALGATDMRGGWVKAGMRLRVSSGPDPTLTEEGGEPVSQYSLVLQPVEE